MWENVHPSPLLTRRVALVSAVLLLALAAVFAVHEIIRTDEGSQAEEESYYRWFAPGETAHLDSRVNDGCIVPLDFEGSMDITIEDAYVVESLDGAGISIDDLEFIDKETGKSSHESTVFLVCDIRYENIDATPLWETESSEPRFRLLDAAAIDPRDGDVLGNLVYLSGADAADDEKNYFTLDKGASKTLRAVYEFHCYDGQFPGERFELQGMGYTFALDVADIDETSQGD